MMKQKYAYKQYLVLLGILCLSLVAQGQNGTTPLTLKGIIYGEFRAKPAGITFKVAEGGAYYTTISADRKKIEQYSFETGKLSKVLFDLSNMKNTCGVKEIEEYDIAPGGNEILIYTNVEYIYRRSWQADAFRYDVRRNQLSPLSNTPGKVMIPTFSPNARMVAFVRNNNIYIRKFDFDTEVAVTTDGKFGSIINGTTDWVYEEEFTATKLLSWSSNGEYLAYARFDETEVLQYGFQIYDFNNHTPLTYQYKYPCAGEKNSTYSLHVYNVNDKVSRTVNLPVEKDSYMPRIEFTSMGGELAAITLNRLQNEMKLFLINPATLVPRVALVEKDKCYVDENCISTLAITSNNFIMISERGGYAQVYSFDKNGQQIRCLTPGNYDVTTIYGVDNNGNVYYQAADETPIARRIFKVTPKGKITLLAGERGMNNATFSSDFSFFLRSRSNREMPPIYTVVNARNGKTVRTLESNEALKQKLAKYRFRPAEFETIKLVNGVSVNAYIIKPSNFDANKKYPLLMVQYSGPNSQEVLDHYEMDWTNYLAEQGYIVACVDGRGTGARGTEWRKCTYQQLGILESDDQIAAAKTLAKLPYIDENRMAIWGWSFGGYNTLLCLCRGEGTFKAGIAVAPVTDWHFYDTIYTERFLRTPQQNPSGYTSGAPLKLARNLKGELLIIHGTADDNVHLRNTLLFTEELVQANIPFEMAVYPNRNHSIYGGNTRLHLFERKIDFLKRKL